MEGYSTKNYAPATRRRQRQNGGAPADYPSSMAPLLSSSMTGPWTSGGSGTGALDAMLSQTSRAVSQAGGSRRRRKHQSIPSYGPKRVIRRSNGTKKRIPKRARRSKRSYAATVRRSLKKLRKMTKRRQRGGRDRSRSNSSFQRGGQGPLDAYTTGVDGSRAGQNPAWSQANPAL